MNSQPYCHVRFTQMFIPSPLVWVVNSSGLLGQCSRGVLLIKITCMAVWLFHPQEQVCRCTGFGCGVSGSAYNTGPPCFQGSDLPQMRSGKRLRSRLCCSGLVHKPTRRSYGRSVSVSLDPTSSGPCPRKKKRKEKFMQTYDFQSQLHRWILKQSLPHWEVNEAVTTVISRTHGWSLAS